MKILSVFDPEFKPYGKVVTGMEETCAEILEGLKKTPLPEFQFLHRQKGCS